MKIIEIPIQDAFIIELNRFNDERGFFIESWNKKNHTLPSFVQDNHSQSKKGVLRGLHYQSNNNSQGKLINCTRGIIFDVIVDLRKHSNTFGEWFGINLDKPELQLWAPPGTAHGFYTISNIADVHYKATKYYNHLSEKVLLWNDQSLAIEWPIIGVPIISEKDIYQAKSFKECDKFE